MSHELDIEKENDEGNIEYKLKLVHLTKKRIEQLATQMKFRLTEGEGECIYKIGYADNGRATGITKLELVETFENLKTVASLLRADVFLHHVIKINPDDLDTNFLAEMRVKYANQLSQYEKKTRVAFIGPSARGKSTLISVLLYGEKDDGRGSVRSCLFQNKNEFISGQTLSCSCHLLALSKDGGAIYSEVGQPINNELIERYVSLIDTPGNPAYQIKVIQALLMWESDFVLIVGDDHEPSWYYSTCAKLEIPCAFVFTGCESTSPLRSACLETPKDVSIMNVSCVTGEGIDKLYRMISSLESRTDWENRSTERLFFVIVSSRMLGCEWKFALKGVIIAGKIKTSQSVRIGPFEDRRFYDASISSITMMDRQEDSVTAGSEVFLCMSGHIPPRLRKGLVIVDIENEAYVVRRFNCKVTVFLSKLVPGDSKSFLFLSQGLTQNVIILDLVDTSDNDTFVAQLEFVHNHEYLLNGMKFVILDESEIIAKGFVTH